MSVVKTRFICACLIMLLTVVGNASDWFICLHEDGWVHTEFTAESDHCCHEDPQHEPENLGLECGQCIDVQFKTVEFLATREDGWAKSAKTREIIPAFSLTYPESFNDCKNRPPRFRFDGTKHARFEASTHWISHSQKVVIRT